jgi:hypothetical protein
MSETPHVHNCQIIGRESDGPLFDMEASAYLDGYTILPTEQYEKMKRSLADLASKVAVFERNQCLCGQTATCPVHPPRFMLP